MTDFTTILAAVRAHAAECAPRECCGLAVVVRGKLRYWPCRNNYTGPDKVFVLNPEDYAAAEDAGAVVAVVHSHVFEPPAPSMADRVEIERSGLPWLIVNHPVGSWQVAEPSGYKAPLLGRPFAHGVLDCYSLVRDYYRETCGIMLPDIPREDHWWLKPGQNLYMDNFEAAGFFQIDERDMRQNDAILMRAASDRPNHAAVYIGDQKIIQHVMGRLSSRDIWGGWWKKNATHYLRHKDLA